MGEAGASEISSALLSQHFHESSVFNHERKIAEECEQNFYFTWQRDLSITLPKEKRFIIYIV